MSNNENINTENNTENNTESNNSSLSPIDIFYDLLDEYKPHNELQIMEYAQTLSETDLSEDGDTALSISCTIGHYNSTQLLIQRGFDLNYQSPELLLTPLISLIIGFANYGNIDQRIEILKYILKLPNNRVNYFITDVYGSSVLYYVCRCYDIRISKMLKPLMEKMKLIVPPHNPKLFPKKPTKPGDALKMDISRDITLNKLNDKEQPGDMYYIYHRTKTCFLTCIDNLYNEVAYEDDKELYEKSVMGKIKLLFKYGNPKDIMDIKFNIDIWSRNNGTETDFPPLDNNCLYFFLLYTHGLRYAIDVKEGMEIIMDGIITHNQEFSVELFKLLFKNGLKPKKLPEIISYTKSNYKDRSHSYKEGKHIYMGLHLCYLNNNFSLAKLLSDYGFLSYNELGIFENNEFLIGYPGFTQNTVLQKAILDRKQDYIDLILDKKEVEVTILSNNSYLDAMYFAVRNNDIDTMRKLLSKGSSISSMYPKSIYLENSDNSIKIPLYFRPLHIAMAYGCFDAVSLILENGDNKDQAYGCSITPRELSELCLAEGVLIKPLFDLVNMEFTPYSQFVEKLREMGTDLNEDEEQCIICFERIDMEGENLVLLKCGHFFHSKCLTGFLTQGAIAMDSYSYKAFCPMCKAGMDRDSDFGIENVSRIRLKDLGRIGNKKFKTKKIQKQKKIRSLNHTRNLKLTHKNKRKVRSMNNYNFVPAPRMRNNEAQNRFQQKYISNIGRRDRNLQGYGRKFLPKSSKKFLTYQEFATLYPDHITPTTQSGHTTQ